MNDRISIAKQFAETINSDKIEKIILFGSVARGDDTIDSDIDLLIVSNHMFEIQDKIDSEVLNYVLETDEFISAHLITENMFNKRKNYPFLTNVSKEGINLG